MTMTDDDSGSETEPTDEAPRWTDYHTLDHADD